MQELHNDLTRDEAQLVQLVVEQVVTLSKQVTAGTGLTGGGTNGDVTVNDTDVGI